MTFFRSRRNGQGDNDFGSFVEPAFGPDLALMSFHDAFANSQSQTGALSLPRDSSLSLIKAVKEAGQGFLHGFAGMVLFLSALALTIFADGVLRASSLRYARNA